jgi:hypothetical protein
LHLVNYQALSKTIPWPVGINGKLTVPVHDEKTRDCFRDG